MLGQTDRTQAPPLKTLLSPLSLTPSTPFCRETESPLPAVDKVTQFRLTSRVQNVPFPVARKHMFRLLYSTTLTMWARGRLLVLTAVMAAERTPPISNLKQLRPATLLMIP